MISQIKNGLFIGNFLSRPPWYIAQNPEGWVDLAAINRQSYWINDRDTVPNQPKEPGRRIQNQSPHGGGAFHHAGEGVHNCPSTDPLFLEGQDIVPIFRIGDRQSIPPTRHILLDFEEGLLGSPGIRKKIPKCGDEIWDVPSWDIR